MREGMVVRGVPKSLDLRIEQDEDRRQDVQPEEMPVGKEIEG
ncbi:MAG: hypothetical protein OXD40_07330 [bacterium]|nr:hypothetical protein [bacterium]